MISGLLFVATSLNKGHASPVVIDPQDIEGWWALEMKAITAARVPVVGDLQSTTRTGVLVRLEHGEDGRWTQIHRPCGTEISGGSIIKTRVPRATFENMSTKVLAPRVTQSGGSLDFVVDVERSVGGWDPTLCEDVPTDPSAACVTDWDNDGNPGVTMKVKAPLFPWVDVYVAQQTHPALAGTASSADRITGSLTVTELNNQVLGASHRLFRANPTTRMRNDLSTFQMDRLSAGGTCDDVLSLYEIDPGW